MQTKTITMGIPTKASATKHEYWPLDACTGNPIFVGTETEFYHSALPEGNYWRSAPHFQAVAIKLNELQYRELFKQADLKEKMAFLVNAVLSKSLQNNQKKIKEILENNYFILYSLIEPLYATMQTVKHPTTGDSVFISCLSDCRSSLSEMVRMGLQIYSPGAKDMLFNLIQYGLDDDVISTAILSHIRYDIDSSNTFGDFREIVLFALEHGKKIDLNIARQANPKFGSYLHYFLAFEMKQAEELIQFLDSVRIDSEKHTHFNFEALDGYGTTPLQIALLTRNTMAALALLQLVKEKNRPVGINIPNSKGQTPLHIAIALGMQEVAEQLIELGASLDTLDNEGESAASYAFLAKEQIEKILSQHMHPDRCNSSISHNQSQLYVLDGSESTPLCLYNESEPIKHGDEQIPNFVILSNTAPHRERLDLAYHALVAQARAGDRWSAEQLPIVKNQIDDIRYGDQFENVVNYLKQVISKGNKVALALMQHILKLIQQNCLLEPILEETRNFLLKTEQKSIDEELLAEELYIEIKKIIETTPERKSEIQKCMDAQPEMQKYIIRMIRSKAPQASLTAGQVRFFDVARRPEKLFEEMNSCMPFLDYNSSW